MVVVRGMFGSFWWCLDGVRFIYLVIRFYVFCRRLMEGFCRVDTMVRRDV